MEHAEWLSERFELHRSHLRAVAYRMLGSYPTRTTRCRRRGCASARPTRATSTCCGRGSRGTRTVRGGKVVALDILADPARLAELDLTVLGR
jgi:hypothetical protein